MIRLLFPSGYPVNWATLRCSGSLTSMWLSSAHAFDDFHFLLFAQLPQDVSDIRLSLPVYRLPAEFGLQYDVVLTSPCGVCAVIYFIFSCLLPPLIPGIAVVKPLSSYHRRWSFHMLKFLFFWVESRFFTLRRPNKMGHLRMQVVHFRWAGSTQRSVLSARCWCSSFQKNNRYIILKNCLTVKKLQKL